jgi:hypothetical protein
MSSHWIRWGNPRYKPIADCKVKELARIKLLYLIDLLEQRGDSPDEMEQTVGFLREEAIGGLSYHTLLLEEELGIERVNRIQNYKGPREDQRVKRTKRAKKKKPKRGGLFG